MYPLVGGRSVVYVDFIVTREGFDVNGVFSVVTRGGEVIGVLKVD